LFPADFSLLFLFSYVTAPPYFYTLSLHDALPIYTTAGYAVGTYLTTKLVFDLKEEDMYWCTADIGWVTGHSYIVYGPLQNGATSLMYEGAPNFPEPDRFWSIIARHKVNVFYTAPTPIRTL